jgi:hypothetical protein
MSRDQRPARVKLVDGAPLAVPARRAGDVQSPENNGETATAASTTPPSSGLLYGAIFLIGCIIGGAGLSLLPMLGLL